MRSPTNSQIGKLAMIVLAAISLYARPACGRMQVYNLPGYYIIHSDESPRILRQIWLRMNFVAQTYERRLHRFFGGDVTQKQPFFIFRHRQEYRRAGGPAGSAGVFIVGYHGQRLMADAGTKITHQMWHTIQHEAFHQFTYAMIGRFFPPWANEGLAEYFGEGLFTGNSFVTGWIPPWRLARVKWEITHHKLKSIRVMRHMRYRQWNDVLMGTNYDEAWSMIYFLAWADHGKFDGPFMRYMALYKNGMSANRAWRIAYGRGNGGFQHLWKKYWMNMPKDPTALLYAKVQTQALTNFLARACCLHQKFASAHQFFARIANGTLRTYKLPDNRWLPQTLLTHAARRAPKLGTWKLTPGGLPHLICRMADGTKVVGMFRLSEGRIRKVWVKVLREGAGGGQPADGALGTVAQ